MATLLNDGSKIEILGQETKTPVRYWSDHTCPRGLISLGSLYGANEEWRHFINKLGTPFGQLENKKKALFLYSTLTETPQSCAPPQLPNWFVWRWVGATEQLKRNEVHTV